MPTITIITTYGAVSVEGSHWARDSDGDLHVYRTDEDGDDESVASVDADRYVAVAEAGLEDSELEVEISAEEFANRLDLDRKTPPQ